MKTSIEAVGMANVIAGIKNAILYAGFQWVTLPAVLACGTVLKTRKDCTRGMLCMLIFLSFFIAQYSACWMLLSVLECSLSVRDLPDIKQN